MLTRETLPPAPEKQRPDKPNRPAASILGLARFLPWLPPFWLARRRVRERWLLLAATLAGLLTSVTVLAALPLYAHGEAERLLQQDLEQRAHEGNLAVGFVYSETKAGPLDPAAHERVDALLRANARGWLGLSTVNVLSAGESATEPVRVLRDGRFVDLGGVVPNGYLGYRHDFFQHIDLVDGRLPAPKPNASGEIEALIVVDAAAQLPIKVGDHVMLFNELGLGPQIPPIKIQIVGSFRPKNPNDPYWYGAPDAYQRRVGMFVGEDTFHQYVLTANQPFGANLSWYFLFPRDEVTSATADTVVRGIEYTGQQVDRTYPQTMVDRGIYAAFERYDQVVQELELQLSLFTAPVIAIVLYYMALATRLLIESQRSEIALLQSRGARDGQIVLLVTVDVLCMAVPALVLGLPLAGLLTHLIGAAYGFLLFAQGLDVPVRFSREALLYGLAGVALAMLSVVVAAVGASRQDVVTRGRALSRNLGRPLWQRFFVDFLLLGVAIYGYTRLRGEGVHLNPTTPNGGPVPLDPLVLALPVVFLAACGLLTARLLPAVAAVLSWLTGFAPFFPLTMALRQVARAPGHYTSLTLLLVWTIGLGTFSTAAARTLDERTVDATYYQVGADVRFDEQGWNDANLGFVTYVPLDLAQQVAGVLGATRVTTARLRQQLVEPYGPIRVVGIDRDSFPAASWFRRDFAPNSL
ncbi:MAG TPA: FtsX-like permease family protein, partial [Chloroflexota bacterium]|nr:FtsX-like permease family protein [Chloroflexota bacterium]